MGFSELLDSGEAMSLVLIWNLTRDLETFSHILLLWLYLLFPCLSSKKPTYFCVSPSLPPKTKLSIGKGCVVCLFLQGLDSLVRFDSLSFEDYLELERCKKILGHFKEKEEI